MRMRNKSKMVVKFKHWVKQAEQKAFTKKYMQFLDYLEKVTKDKKFYEACKIKSYTHF